MDRAYPSFAEKKDQWCMGRHRNVTRKLVVEGGWVQQRFYDIGCSDEKKCRGRSKEEGTEKHRSHHCPCLKEVRNLILEKTGQI